MSCGDDCAALGVALLQASGLLGADSQAILEDLSSTNLSAPTIAKLLNNGSFKRRRAHAARRRVREQDRDGPGAKGEKSEDEDGMISDSEGNREALESLVAEHAVARATPQVEHGAEDMDNMNAEELLRAFGGESRS